MSGRGRDEPRPTRRSLFRAVAGFTGAAGAVSALSGLAEGASEDPGRVEPFWGPHQAGITTPPQRHTYAASFDLVAPHRGDLVAMLRLWTEAAARLCTGTPSAGEAKTACGSRASASSP